MFAPTSAFSLLGPAFLLAALESELIYYAPPFFFKFQI